MKHKLLSFTIWSIFFIAVVITLGFVKTTHDGLSCSEVLIHIDHSDENYFIEKKDIEALLPFDLTSDSNVPIASIEADNLEHHLTNHPAIARAEVYIHLSGKLSIQVWQRKPMVRIFNESGESYYIDTEGSLMPLSDKFTARVMVITGSIHAPFNTWSQHSIESIMENDTLRTQTLLDDLFELAKFIYENEFWRAQIEHLYVNKDSEVELIPRVGSHTIVLGEIRDIERKFEKLMVFYRQGLSKTGWNEYSKINLKFENQVVCTKRYN